MSVESLVPTILQMSDGSGISVEAALAGVGVILGGMTTGTIALWRRNNILADRERENAITSARAIDKSAEAIARLTDAVAKLTAELQSREKEKERAS